MERLEYDNRVNALFLQNEFLDLSSVQFRNVIAGCCCERQFKTAKEVVVALKEELRRYTLLRS
jgi:hypothetical protein